MAAATTASTAARRVPSLFICHGGGPMPLLNDPGHDTVVAAWRKHVADYYTGEGRRPAAIVVISAHYETSGAVRVGGAARPKMLYDYGGFPRESYSIQYPAPGHPELADRMVGMLTAAGIKAELEPDRPFDHGVFVPLKIMFPDADIPVVPLSVLRSQDAAEHIKIGRALAALRGEGVLFLGSGSSAHNFGSTVPKAGTRFNDALTAIITDAALSAADRSAALSRYLELPGVAEAQRPGAAEHLTPLFTTLGTAGGNEAGREVANVLLSFPPLSWNERHWLFDNAPAATDAKADL